jgi:putative transcriptional regulator
MFFSFDPPVGPGAGVPGPEPTFTPAELAALYAAGALTPDETADFERRVVAGEAAYVLALAEVESTRDRLLDALAAQPVQPARSVRAALEARLAAEPDRAAPADADVEDDDNPFADRHDHDHEHEHAHELVGAGIGADGSERALPPGINVVRAGEGRWRSTGIRGVRYRTLLADRRANRRTILLQMDPGTELPEHGHTGIEEVIMLSGDLDIAGRTLGPGDYISILPSADHGVPFTRSGCTCIVVSGYVPFPLSSALGFIKSVIRSLRGKSGRP